MRKFVFGGSYASVVPLLLDLYPATVAYSLRKLRTAYTGAAIRVRRSSDNTEQDIGFVGNDLDTASLLSFVGAGNGFVNLWYDQSLNVANLPQATGVSQPQIVSSGTIITRDGFPAIKFDGSNDFLQRSGIPPLNTSSLSFFSVSNNDVDGSISVIHSQNSVTNNTIRTFCDRSVNMRHLSVNNTVPVTYNANLSTQINTADLRLLSSFIDASKNMSAFDNGATGGTNTYVGTTNNNGLRLGSQLAAGFLNGTILEFIAYNTDESANRTAIESNINGHYGIY